MNIDQIKEALLQATPEEMATLLAAIKEQNPFLADELIRIFQQQKK